MPELENIRILLRKIHKGQGTVGCDLQSFTCAGYVNCGLQAAGFDPPTFNPARCASSMFEVYVTIL